MVKKGEKSGLAAAVELTGPRGIVDKAAEQLSLLPTPTAAAMALDQSGDGEIAVRRGRGRPPGSRNKRTEEWQDFILSRWRSPLLFLAEAYTRPVEDLAAELGCKLHEAFKVQVEAAERLAPYVHQKQPVAVEVTEKGIVQLILEAPPAGPAQGGGDGPVIDVNAELVEPEGESQGNQGVSDGDGGEV